jgi:hypothetical protein
MAINQNLRIQQHLNLGDKIVFFWRPIALMKAYRLYVDLEHDGTYPALVQEIANFPTPSTQPLGGSISVPLTRTALASKTSVTAPGATTAALAGAGAGNVDDGTHSWKITFVTALGETTAGTASNIVTVTDKTMDGRVNLTAIPVGPSTVTARKVYRTVAGDAGAYKLVTTITNNTATTYTDNLADSGLGADAPSSSTTVADELFFLITSVDGGGVESNKADSPIRTVLQPMPAEIILPVSDREQYVSLNFVSSSITIKNTGASEALVRFPQAIVQIDSSATYEGIDHYASVLGLYCNAGETTTLRISGGVVN